MTATPAKSDKLGLQELAAIGVGCMVGGGIFSVLGFALSIAGLMLPRQLRPVFMPGAV
ncbi:MAG: hypothetical protein JRJ56_01975 [Deltaproteobacteria bacterium]|nr:hypothetical protein [Deltaproteobacteria bacterium]